MKQRRLFTINSLPPSKRHLGASCLPTNPEAIFVFGSNKSGVHGAGAAKVALKRFEAVSGAFGGLIGRSYAIPTKGRIQDGLPVLSLEEIAKSVEAFCWVAIGAQTCPFFVTRVGCGLAGGAKYRHDNFVLRLSLLNGHGIPSPGTP